MKDRPLGYGMQQGLLQKPRIDLGGGGLRIQVGSYKELVEWLKLIVVGTGVRFADRM